MAVDRLFGYVILSFSGTAQRDAATILTRNAFRAAIGLMPADIRSATFETPASDSAVALIGLASQPGDLIVVGTGGGHLLRHLFHGSARHALWPVVVVPAQVQACPLRRTSPYAGPSAMSAQSRPPTVRLCHSTCEHRSQNEAGAVWGRSWTS